jgi:nicotinamidase-related amidase
MVGFVSASTLVLVDLQAALMPAIDGGESVIARCKVLAEAARLLEIPVFGTEQNPEGLGATVAPIAPLLDRVFPKLSFDATADSELVPAMGSARRSVVIAGCEAHVCLMQTALGLRRLGFAVSAAADAIGSRHAADRAVALDRLARAGVEIVTSEMAVFEWLARSDHPRFKEILALVR